MPETIARAGQTSYPTTVAGGTIPTDLVYKGFVKWSKNQEPWKTPLLDKIERDVEYDLDPVYFGTKGRVNLESTVASGGGAGSVTLNVAAGTGVNFQKYMVLEVTNYRAGSTTEVDPTNRELVWVSAEPSTDALTIVRAQGGTSDVAHAAGARVKIVGTAEPQLQFHTIAPFARGFQSHNEWQRFEGGVKADLAAQNVRIWGMEGNPMMADFREEQIKQRVLLEQAVWNGGRQAGAPSTPVPAMMGSVRTFITTNVTNVGGATLTRRVLEAELRDLAKNTVDGPEGLALLMGYDEASVMDELLEPVRFARTDDTSVTLFTEKVRFRWGTYDIMVSHNAPQGEIWGVRLKNLHVVSRKGADWHTSEIRGKENGADHDQIFTSADKTLVVENEEAMFRLYNFTVDVNAYAA